MQRTDSKTETGAKRVLIIEDDKALAVLMQRKLESDGYVTDWADSGEEGITLASKGAYGAAILDYKMPGVDGLVVLEKIRAESVELPIIFVTAHGDNDVAFRSLQLGADEYLDKPFNFNTLSFYVKKHISLGEQREKQRAAEARGGSHPDSFVFKSGKMRKIVDRLRIYAASDMPVLICGETGTGKDVLAELIRNHPNNPRAGKPFFAVNCMAIPENLVESELFGHMKGAFTGALLDKKGFFEVASGGAIFLDEISGATPGVQGKLLRIMESGEFYRVGDTKTVRTDVRIIAATNVDLLDEVQEGRFRQDLYYRLNGFRLDIPPLRERIEDIAPLAKHFLSLAGEKRGADIGISDEALEALEAHDWPGNVRELRSAIMAAVSLCENGTLMPDDFPVAPKNHASPSHEQPRDEYQKEREAALERFDREYFTALLKKTGGNVTHAAKAAGISRQNVLVKLKNVGLDPSSFR